MKTSTLLNEKNINASLIVFCIMLAGFIYASSRFYHNYQIKQDQIEIESISK